MPCLETTFHGDVIKQKGLHATWSTNNLLNRDNSLLTSAHEESSMDAPTLNMLLSSSKFIIKSNKCECLGLGLCFNNKAQAIKTCHGKGNDKFQS
jgi:hypothetical protein